MKKIKNKYIRIFVSVIVLLIGFYLGYKFYYLSKYKVSSNKIASYNTFLEFLESEKTIEITKVASLSESYLEFNNIKIRNDWDNSLEIIEEEKSRKYISKDENGNVLFYVWFYGPEENMIDAFIKDSKKSDNGNYKKYYIDNNVFDLTSLLKYLVKNKDKKANIFTNSREIEWLYTMNILPATIFEGASNLTFITKDFNGIMYDFKDQNAKSVMLFKDDLTYGITFFGLDYFNDEYVLDLLNTVEIEG